MNRQIRCIIVDDEPIAREILSTHLTKIDFVEVIAECKNAMEAFKIINEQAIDLVFLDISMPEISGLSFARSLNRELKIIFTTAYRDYAADGFDLQAVDYLLKPISFDRLLQSVYKFLNENKIPEIQQLTDIDSENNNGLFVRSERKMIRIDFSEVRFIESISDYIKIHLENKTIVTRETLLNIEAKLPVSRFLKIHRSFIVAVDRIDSYTNEYVEIGKRQIPISRSHKESVLKRLED
ncbi:LytR/AlgR family response regulator transcription factor [Bacteroidota bacterium]